MKQRTLALDEVGIELQLRLQPGMPEGSEIKQAADRHAALDDVCRQSVFTRPIGRDQHADLMAASRMTGDEQALGVAVVLRDILRYPGHRSAALARDLGETHLGAQRIVRHHHGHIVRDRPARHQ